MRAPSLPHRRANGGFTLAEAAVTIAIVGIVLLAVMQGLQGAKMASLNVKNQKTAYELGTGLIGEIRVGLYREELESGMTGDFAEQEEPDFRWEVTLGDDVFTDADDSAERPFDNLQDRRDREEERENSSDSRFTDDEDEEAAEPFEKVKVRVTYPAVEEYPTELLLEAWIPWEEVYGPEEEEELDGQSVGGPPGQNVGGGSTVPPSEGR
ncbi:MAG: prepilin-type N-terminal cleavage/methylation domain-containing protein [Planctomycetota bacterium]|nr:prepilin-type N-terminal cleavage/methylation domain-containing protein [Planctomycetota bacterium]